MSMGANHSLGLAAQYPQLVERLVIVDFAPKIEDEGYLKILASLNVEVANVPLHRAHLLGGQFA